jgi:hypothetical protein
MKRKAKGGRSNRQKLGTSLFESFKGYADNLTLMKSAGEIPFADVARANRP